MVTTEAQILIADDDPDFLRLMDFHISRWGYRPVTAGDKPSVLRRLEEGRPDLVLMDVRFGEHDGVELLRWLQLQRPNLGVVMLTAFGSIDSAVSAIRIGARDYITKPVDLNRLRLTISHALDARPRRPRRRQGPSRHQAQPARPRPGGPSSARAGRSSSSGL